MTGLARCALEGGPCLLCARPGLLRRPYGWLCDEHSTNDEADGTSEAA